MDYRPQCKTQNRKLLDDNIGKNLDDLEYGDDILDTTSKTCSIKEVMISWPSSTLKTSALQKILSRE